VQALSGLVIVLTALLACAGVFKVARPALTAGALRAMRLPSRLGVVRALGIGEIVLGLATLVTGARPLLALSAAAYLGFAGFVAAALVSGAPLQSCGCFGQRETPPSAVHLGFNLVAAATLLVAAAGNLPEPADVLADQPWHGAPFVFLTATSLALAYLVLTALPDVLLSPRSR
jgi:hypothetical protein